MFFTIYRREAWNRLDLLILVLTSPQARQNSRDGHRVCEGLFSHYCVHTCWIPFGLPGRRFQAMRPTPDGKQLLINLQVVLHPCTLPFLASLCRNSVFHNIPPMSGLSRHRPLSTPGWNVFFSSRAMKAFTNGWLAAPVERQENSVTALKALSVALLHRTTREKNLCFILTWLDRPPVLDFFFLGLQSHFLRSWPWVRWIMWDNTSPQSLFVCLFQYCLFRSLWWGKNYVSTADCLCL